VWESFSVDSNGEPLYAMSMNITFYGATRVVTGSCTLIECGNKKLLVDCGLPQGHDERVIGLQLPCDPRDIDYVLLTHAHIDHTGRVPLLVKEGFRGIIYSTEATEDLCSIMLADSGYIQESEAEWQSRKNIRAGEKPVEPLYRVEDAHNALNYFVSYPYDEPFQIAEGIEATFIDAGHMLGSAYIILTLSEGGQTRKLLFSGDIGNTNQPLINDPSIVKGADFVIMESTYGDRLHPPVLYESEKEAILSHAQNLAIIIAETFAKGGNVVIPTFAVGRTQEILYLLRTIIYHKMLPGLPTIDVFLDSPLAIEATKIFSRNIDGYFDEESLELVKQGINPLLFDSLTLTVTAQESIALNSRKESCVIISSSGMCEAGRIKHHLKHNLWRKESTVVFTGYQATGTLGRSISDGAKRVTLFGEKIDIKAKITKLEGLSGHADQKGLLSWVQAMSDKPKHIFVVHGEERVALYFAGLLGSELHLDAWAPHTGQSFDLLEEKLPVAEKERRWIVGVERLKEALAQLSATYKGVDLVKERLEEHAQEAFKTPDATDIERLSDAVQRFAEELESLRGRWEGPQQEY
jgi:metallo-beta-lactamase family protein